MGRIGTRIGVRATPGAAGRWIALLGGALAAGPALAQNSVFLDPPTRPNDGQPLTFDLRLAFTDPAIGGGIVVEFDPLLLSFDGFAFDPTFLDDPGLRLVCPSASPACASFPGPGALVAFAVDTISFPPLVGSLTVGTLTFTPVAAGAGAIGLREDDSVAGPIIGTGSFAVPTLIGATVQAAHAVPALTSGGGAVLLTTLIAIGTIALQRGGRPRDGQRRQAPSDHVPRSG